MELKGLKINFLGDSITQGVGASSADSCYVSQFAKMTGATCRNYGISGTRIARRSEPYTTPTFDRDFCMRAVEMAETADVIVVFGGTNDFGHGDAPIGKKEDRTVWSFYGALHVLYDILLDRYPNAKIVILTPLRRAEEERDGKTLPPFVDAIRDVVKEYSFPMLDLYADFPVNLHDTETQHRYIPDGLHPNDAGHKLIAETIIQFLEKL